MMLQIVIEIADKDQHGCAKEMVGNIMSTVFRSVQLASVALDTGQQNACQFPVMSRVAD